MGTGEQAWEAAVRYDEFRRSCYTKTLDSIALLRGEGIIPGAITEIFLCAVGLEQANEAMTWTDRRFDWVKKVEEFHPYINRFEVSVYSSGQLCALTLGRPSKGLDNVTIHFLER